MTIHKKVVFKTEWFTIEEDHFDELSHLQGKPFYRFTPQDGVIILARTEQGQLILVKQYRPSLEMVTLELPCGAVEEGESPLVAAQRELEEETGYRCKDLKYIGAGRFMMNRNTAQEHLFFADGAVPLENPTSSEISEVLLVDPERFRHLAVSGEFEQFSGLALVLMIEWKLGIQVAPRETRTSP